ncbi:MAG: hypothetical protein RSB77_07285 [Bacilli bacterium]
MSLESIDNLSKSILSICELPENDDWFENLELADILYINESSKAIDLEEFLITKFDCYFKDDIKVDSENTKVF